jgi:hypothetical protein
MKTRTITTFGLVFAASLLSCGSETGTPASQSAAIREPHAPVDPVAANRFQLGGEDLQIAYSADETGHAVFVYTTSYENRVFRGDEIHALPTEAGMLVTVSLPPRVDSGPITVSLLVPNVHVRPNGTAMVDTQVIMVGRPLIEPWGQIEQYGFAPLHGTATYNGVLRWPSTN